VTHFLNRLGDRMNPIVVKEARQAVNSRMVSGALLLFLGVQLTVMLLMLTGRSLPGEAELDLRVGRQVFTFVQGVLLGACILLIPLMTGGRLAVERSDARVDLLFITSLSPRAIVFGKLATAAALALLMFSACAPFMAFAYVLRGLDVPTIFVVLTSDFILVLFATMLALFLASIPATRGFRIFLGIFGFIGMCYLTGGMLTVTSEFLERGVGADPSGWEFWGGFGGMAAAALGIIGLLFVWSVALISPHAANRAVAVRAYTLAFWAAAAAGLGYWAKYISHPGPVEVWAVFGAILFGIQLLTAVSERDHWGPRVARKIPRRVAWRVPAFLFYSGAAGGLLFGLLGGGLTLLGVVLWHEWYPSAHWPNPWWKPVQMAGLILGYTYCYAMTAVLIRRLAHGTQLRIGYTWLVALILFGLGCLLPYIVGYALFDTHSRYGRADDLLWLYLTNPAVTLDDTLRPGGGNEGMIRAFVAVWAVAVTLLNVPWLAGQVSRFRPPRDRDDHPASGGRQPPDGAKNQGAYAPRSPEAPI
jgi:hypothetical protein